MSAGGMARRVLVLDDEPVILMDLEYELREAGFDPVIASSEAHALDAIDRAPLDAAVLDVNLGGGTTCEAVALRLSQLGVPFVLHSGDLARRGELVTRFDVAILPKPSAGPEIARALRALPPPGGIANDLAER